MRFVRVLRLLTVLGAALVLPGVAAYAQVDPTAGEAPDLRGDNSRYDDATKQVVVTGNARLTARDVYLTADEIRFNFATREAGARGNVVITSGQRRLVADEGTYNTATGVIAARNLRLGQFPI